MSYPTLAVNRRSLLRAGGAGLGLAGLASLAACAPSSNGGTAGGGTLKMLYFGDQKSATAVQNALAPEVKKLDKNAKLVVDGINGTDWNDFITKVLTQIAAGSPPDIISVATEGLQLMASKDLAIPLDSYVTKDMAELKKSYFSDVHPSLIESMMYQGHLYELTDSFNAGNMFYSTSLFQKAGVEEPSADWTIQDFENTAKKIAKVSTSVNAFDWVVRLWGSWTSFMYANGGNLVEEGKYSGGDWLWSKAYAGDPAAAGRAGGFKWGTPTANSPATVEALNYMVELKKMGLAPSPDVGGGQTLQGLFASSRIGMAIGGGFWAGGLHNAGMADGSFNVQLFPKWTQSKALFGNGGYGILRSSKQPDLAWEVLKLLVAPTSFDLVFPGNVTTPSRKSLMTAERYATTGPKNWDVFYSTLTDHPNTTPIPAPPYYDALATALNTRSTQAISSGNAKAALDSLQTDLESAASAS